MATAPVLAAKPTPVCAVDLNKTFRFFRSVALTHAIAQTTTLEWRTYDDSSLVNALYWLMPSQKPGYAVVDSASGRKLQDLTQQFYEQFVDNWLACLPLGPVRMKQYLDRLERIRQMEVSDIEQVFREARRINDEVVGELNSAIRRAAAVKVVSTIAVAALGGYAAIAIGGATATIAGATSTAYSATGALIKEWHHLPSAQVTAVSVELDKAIVEHGIEEYSEELISKSLKNKALQEQVLNKACRQIEHYRQIAVEAWKAKARRRATGKMLENLAKAKTADQAIARASKLARVGETAALHIPIVFALWDAVEGVKDYQEDVEDAD